MAHAERWYCARSVVFVSFHSFICLRGGSAVGDVVAFVVHICMMFVLLWCCFGLEGCQFSSAALPMFLSMFEAGCLFSSHDMKLFMALRRVAFAGRV